MKIAGLVIGILGMLLSFIVFVVCLLLPSMTSNRVKFEEALFGIIPSILVFIIALVITVICAILVLKSRKAKQSQQQR